MKLLERRFQAARALTTDKQGQTWKTSVFLVGVLTTRTTEAELAQIVLLDPAAAGKRFYTVFTSKDVNLFKGMKIRLEDSGQWLMTNTNGEDTPTSPLMSNLSYYSAQAESYNPSAAEEAAPNMSDVINIPEQPDTLPPLEDFRLFYVIQGGQPWNPIEELYQSYIFEGRFNEDTVVFYVEDLQTLPHNKLIWTSSIIRRISDDLWYQLGGEPVNMNEYSVFSMIPFTPTYQQLNSIELDP